MAMEHHGDHLHHHQPLHIAVFPWLAFGHMMPFLELSKTLASKGHHISYLTTPTNISKLSSLSSSSLSPLITFIPLPLPLPPNPNLPPLAGATSDVSPDQVQHLKLSLDSLHLPFTTFLHESSPKPNWLLLDFATPWAITIASSFSIPCAFFSIFTASFLTFLGPSSELTDDKGSRTSPENFTLKPNWIPFPSNLSYSLHGAKTLMAIYENNVSGISDISRYRKTLEGCKAFGIRTCMEVEGEFVKLLRDLHQKPVFPLGLLAPRAAVVEALGFGHPLMLLPIFVDQEANARLVVERGFGVEVKRREEDGYFGKEEVVRVLRLVMVEKEGDGVRVRVRAGEMKKVFGDAVGQDKYVDDFVMFLKGNN